MHAFLSSVPSESQDWLEVRVKACSLEEMLWQTYTAYWKLRHHFADKGQYSQSYGFSTSHVQMRKLDLKEGWALYELILLNCRAGDFLRDPWTSRRSNQSILKKINPKYSLEGLMLKLKFQYFGHLRENWLIGKDPDAGKDWGQGEKQAAEDEMVK